MLVALVGAGSPGPAAGSCLDGAASVEQAAAARTEYAFTSPGHAVEAEGVAWLGLEGDALSLLGSEPGCFHGGLVDGPYDDASVYECSPTHCPVGGCPEPCLAYHTTACVAPESSGGQTFEGLECAHYGDGISRESASGDVVLRRVHLRDLNDDAVEDDYGRSDTRVFDSLIDGVHIAFGDRQRSSQNNDATGTEWEVRRNLVRVRPNQNPYKRRPGHGGIWKADASPSHQHRYRVTNNVFVAQGQKQGGILFPVAGYLDECAGNVLLWAGPIAGTGGWEESLLDGDGFADGLTDGQRLAALNAAFPGCFEVVVKPEAQPVAEFLASPLAALGGKSWQQLVAEFRSANAAPSVTITAPADGVALPAGAPITFTASASDPEDGDLSNAIAWSSSLAGPLGSGASVVRTDLALGTHVVSATVFDAGGHAGSASVTLSVEDANTAPAIAITAPADGTSAPAGSAVTFSASATDAEDGDLSNTILWSSSLSGPLGSGASLTRSDLALGAHVITAAASDAGGRTSSASVALTIADPNTAPTVAITAPEDGTTVTTGTAVGFAANASDAEDGDLSDDVVWTSSLGGFLGTGATLERSDLAAGVHTLTASVGDTGGRTSSASVTLTVRDPNTPPSLAILAPVDGAIVSAGTPVTLSASASDAEDGNLSSAVAWSSSLAGALGSGASLTLSSLAPGTHGITARVADAGGLAASASVTLVVNALPVVTITAPANNASFKPGAAITFSGNATDLEDGSLSAAIMWSSNKEGVLGTGATLTRALTIRATHVITATATDSRGTTGIAQIQVRIRK